MLVVVVPVDVEGGLDARPRQQRQLGLRNDVGLLDLQRDADSVHDLGHRAADQIPGVFHAAGTLQRRRIQRNSQPLPTECTRLLGQLDAPVHQLLIQVVRDRARTKPHQTPLPKRRLVLPQRPQNQLPAAVILCRFDRVRVAEPVVALQQHHHRQQRRRARVLTSRTISLEQSFFEAVRKQLLPDLPQESVEAARFAQPLGHGSFLSTLGRIPSHTAFRSRPRPPVDPPRRLCGSAL